MRSALAFGPYEFDPRTRELHKHGIPIKLRGQSLEVLATLAEHPGYLVTREELQAKLWPGVRYADFDTGLNSALNRLRDALGDSAHEPHYIETIPRRGYRFIATLGLVRKGEFRIVVLPFENLNRDFKNDVLADAVTDALITELGSVSTLRVISRQSVLHLKGTQKTVPELGRELKVDAVVEGSVLRAEGRIRITAQLVQVDPEQHLWARAFDCGLADLLTTQGQVARAIAEAVRLVLLPSELGRLCRPRPVDPEAHVLYLKGRHHMGQWSGDSLQKALEYFHAAVHKDSNHALAYAHMADCYAQLGHWGHVPFKETFRKAKEAALRSLALDDGLSTAHWALGWAMWMHDWAPDACEAETLRAIQLNPSDERAHELYSVLLATTRGDPGGAVREIQLALDLDPLSQYVNAVAAWVHLWVKDYARAVEQARKTLELFPESLQCYHVMGLSEACRGRYVEAIAALEQAAAISPDAISKAYLGCVHARAGETDIAVSLLNELLARSRRKHVPPRSLVFLYAALGDHDQAFEWLDRAYDVRDSGLFWLRVMPVYDPLRSDPRFQKVLRRLGLQDSRMLRRPAKSAAHLAV